MPGMSAALPLGRAAPDDDPTPFELLATRPHLSVHPADGLMVEGVPLRAVADALGTPCWVLSAGAIRHRLGTLRRALDGAGLQDAAIHYAVKANDHLAVLALVARAGAGADVVSGGELRRAVQAGIPAARIVFSGVGKTDDELRLALAEGVGQVNVESAEELERLSGVAAGLGRVADVALRVNPDVDAGTHAKITTGRAGNKFGIAWDEAPALYARAAGLPGIRAVGLAVHIGSQILRPAPFRMAWERLAGMVRGLRAAGHAVEAVDCGGGVGVGYRNELAMTPDAFAGAMRASLGGLGVRLAMEPGRFIVAQAGVLLASVVTEKHTGARRFVVLDAAMNDLLRPAMYEAWHGMLPVSAADAVMTGTEADIVGPVCETGDTFARDRRVPPLRPGARVALLDAGAYGAVMSSTYNARPLAPIAMVDGENWAVVRPRQVVEAMWANETVPAWA